MCKRHYYKWRRRNALNESVCSIDGCVAPAYIRGWCSKHYGQWYKYGDPSHRVMATRGMTAEQRFWHYVRTTDACWIWTGELNETGYGRLFNGRKRVFAHRFAYELLVGPIPDSLPLDHLCRVPACVNPAHLEPVTTRTNVLRGIAPAARNAVKTHCLRGHPLDAKNTRVDAAGGRHCKTCRVIRQRAARAAERAARRAS